MKRHRALYLLILLLLIPAPCLAPINAFAAVFPTASVPAQAEILQEGTCGEHLKWTLDANGTFTLSGTGDMLHYTGPGSGDAPWLKAHDQIRAVVIEEGVTAIGNYAFFGCENLQSVSLPQSLTTIGNYAFFNCNQLTHTSFPDHLLTIGDYAFAGCGLATVTLPASLSELGASAFWNNADLRTALLMGTLETIPHGAFGDCTALTEVYLSSAVRHIVSFDGCKNLRNVYYTGTTTQWYEIHLPVDKNDPLHKANITFRYQLPSNIIDSTGVSARFYTTVPFTALRTGENRDLLVRLYKNDALLTPADGLLLNSLSSGIVGHETLPDGWKFAFAAGHDAYPEVEFYIPGTDFTADAAFYIHNGTHAFHSFDPWMPEYTRSTLQMDHFHCESSAHTFQQMLSFDAYNTAYSWGVVIANDGQGAPGVVLPIPSKINDGADILVDGQRYLAVDMDTDGKWFTSTTAYPVRLEFQHDNHQVIYTADGSDSTWPALFTAIHVFTRWAVAEAGLDLTGEELQSVSLSMMNWVLDEHVREIAETYGQRLHTLLKSGNTTQELFTEVYALYLHLGVDVRAALRLGLVEQRPALASQTLSLPAVAPSEEALLAAQTRDPELAWPAMDYAFNLYRGSAHIAVRRDNTNTLQAAGAPLHVTSDRPFDRFTVLEASPLAPADGLGHATDGLSDAVRYDFRLLVKGNAYNPATAFELPHRPLTVVLELPESLFGRSCAVYRVNDDGTRTFVHADIRGRTAAFETDCTGTYIVGAVSAPTMPDLLVIVPVLMVGAAFWLYRRKYPKSEKNEDE